MPVDIFGGHHDRDIPYEDLIHFYMSNTLKGFLKKTDEFAEANVKRGDGGPFGASLHVFSENIHQKWLNVGPLAANAVLKKGMASAHAENEVMSPENVNELKATLTKCGSGAMVVLASSGESCPACHAKEEILARTLKAEGLIEDSQQFLVIHGATYEQTRTVAGFNDEPYLLDMQKPEDQRLVKAAEAAVADVPEAVANIFAAAETPVAVVVKDGKVLGFGFADRENDLMATAEVSALRDACTRRKDAGQDQPWNLEGATLYTSTKDAGPLAYAECLWANVTSFVTVNHPRQAEFATQEAPGIDNKALFAVVANRPYNGYKSAIHVADFSQGFENRAQLAWKEKIEAERVATGLTKSLYNGATPS